MSVVTVCKNVIASNNKQRWRDPAPAIRVAKTRAGKVTARGSTVEILDKKGDVVATILTTTDGSPIVKCGAKVAIITKYDVNVF